MNSYACVPLKARKPCRTFFCRCRCMSNELKKGSQQKSSGSEALFLQIFAYLFHPFDPLDPFLPMDFWFKGFFIWKNLEPTVLRLLMGTYFKQSRSWAVQGLSSWVGAVFSSETTRCSLLCVGVCLQRPAHPLSCKSKFLLHSWYLSHHFFSKPTDTNRANPVNHRLPFEINQEKNVTGDF